MALVDQSGMFRAKSQLDLAAVRDKLAAAEADLPALEQRVKETALAAALGDGDEHRRAIIARNEQRDVIETLALAVEEAERAERDRLNDARNRELRAKDRAFKQHYARAKKGAADVQASVAAYAAAVARFRDATAAAAALLPPGLIGNTGYFALTARAFEAGIANELTRVGHAPDHTGWRAWLPGAGDRAALGGDLPHLLRPLVDIVEEAAERDCSQYERDIGLAEPLELEPPVERVYEDFPAVGTERWYELNHPARDTPEWFAKQAREAAAPETAAPGIDRVLEYMPTNIADEAPSEAADEPINPHEPGTPEAAEYAHELALLRATATAPEDDQSIVVAAITEEASNEAAAAALEDDQGIGAADTLHDVAATAANA